MDDQLTRAIRRWREAEARGAEEDADATFSDVFQSIARTPPVSSNFTARTVAAIVEAAERDRRRARRIRTVGVPAAMLAGLVALYFGAGFVVSGVSAALVWLLNSSIAVVVAAATALEAGPDGWTIVASLGRAIAAVITNPAVTVSIFAMQAFAITALIVLRRLLGSDRESFR